MVPFYGNVWKPAIFVHVWRLISAMQNTGQRWSKSIVLCELAQATRHTAQTFSVDEDVEKFNLASVAAETFAWFLHFIWFFELMAEHFSMCRSKSSKNLWMHTFPEHAEEKIWQHKPFFRSSTLFHCTSTLHAFSKQALLQMTKLHPKCKNRIPTKTCKNESDNVGCKIFWFLLLKNRFHEYTFADLGRDFLDWWGPIVFFCVATYCSCDAKTCWSCVSTVPTRKHKIYGFDALRCLL